MRNLLFRHQFSITKKIFKSNFQYCSECTKPKSFSCTIRINSELKKAQKLNGTYYFLTSRSRKLAENELKTIEILNKELESISRSDEKSEDKKRLIFLEEKKQDLDDEHFLEKEWLKFIDSKHKNQMEQLERALKSQQDALEELKKDNLCLYDAAIQLDKNWIQNDNNTCINSTWSNHLSSIQLAK